MTTPSNLYAEKIFAEHPLSLWALDENVDYFSYVDSDTYLDDTTYISQVVETSSYPGIKKFSDHPVFQVELDAVTPGAFQVATATAVNGQNILFTVDAGELVISSYFHASTVPVATVSIGYVDNALGVQVPQSFAINRLSDDWLFVSARFNLSSQRQIAPYFNVTYAYDDDSLNKVYFHGVNVSHSSEEFLPNSMGINSSKIENLSSIAGLTGLSGIAASSYGLASNSGYYAASGSRIFAKNSGIPMVYGAQNVTRLCSNGVLPSLIIPSGGFLSEDSLSSEYTAEFWLRAKAKKFASGKIFGPVDSDSGLYIDGEFVRLKIDSQISSHYIGNWFRPMLIDVRISESAASLLINSEEVLSLDISSINRENLSSNEWSGFYVPDGVDYLEVDAVAIFSYLVPSILAKRRMAYAQGVEAPDGTSKTFGGKLALVDYSVADYTSNYSYPDIGKFNQGISSNMTVNTASLSAPQYPSQPVFFKSSNLESLIANSNNQDQLLGYSGLSLLQDTCYFKIDKFSLINSEVFGLYGLFEPGEISSTVQLHVESEIFSNALVSPNFETGDKLRLSANNSVLGEYYAIRQNANSFKIADTYSDALAGVVSESYNTSHSQYLAEYINDQTIILVYNKTNGDSFRISLSDGGLRYSSNISSIYSEMLFEPGIADYPLFTVGFSLENISQYFDQYLGSFFANPSQLEVYIGANPDFSDRFIGTIYRFGLCDSLNYSQISQYFLQYSDAPYDVGSIELNPNGDPSFWSLVLDGGNPGTDYGISQLLSHVATYTIVVKNTFGVLSLDIATNSYWQDSIALSHFAQYVNSGSSRYYDIDFIQFNIDYASNHDTSSGTFDSEDSKVRTYISFQPTSSGANARLESFSSIKKLESSRAVIPGADWLTSAYEVVDKTIIYLPKDFTLEEMSLVTHLEMNVDGVNVNNVSIKRIEYASQAFNDETANPIGTKYGVDLFPFTKYGAYFDYKAVNPYSIYKRSTPHLYLTDSSGIEVLGQTDQYVSRGILMQVNESLAPSYRIKSLQVFVMPTLDKFPILPFQIFEVEHISGIIKFFVRATNRERTRGVLQAIDSKTGNVLNGIAYYINGSLVKDAVLTVSEWSAIGISFSAPLAFDLFTGAIRMSGNMLFNSLSYYESSKLEEIERQAFRTWENVRVSTDEEGVSELNVWSDTLQPQPGQTYNWGEVLVLSSTDYYGADIGSLYGAYIGTNKLIVDDNIPTIFGASRFVVKNGISKSSFTITAV